MIAMDTRIDRSGATPGDQQAEDARDRSESREEQTEMIAANSPEGRPGDPTLRASGMMGWGMVIIGGVVLGAIVIGVNQGAVAGLFALVLGLCLGVIANSEVWAAASRAKERHDLDSHKHEHAGHR